MKLKAEALVKLRLLFSSRKYYFLSLPKIQVQKHEILWVSTYSTRSTTPKLETVAEDEIIDNPSDTKEIFRRWGCDDRDIGKLFARQPSLKKADCRQLHIKLNVLEGLGISGHDLVKIINCRPRFLSCRINKSFNERIEFFMSLFESKDILRKAIVRNPSLLTYDFGNKIKPTVSQYEEIGVSKKDLVPMLLSRPTIISRTSFNDEKLEYIRKTGLAKDGKMYKYVVTIIGVSRVETIRQKLANLEKFGFTEDEIFGFVGRSPLILTLSVDKVQRNMTFVLATLKLPANVVLRYPFLLFCNLETLLKPRVLLSRKMKEMGLDLQIKGPTMFRALRMTEKRFLRAFVTSQPQDVADELMDFYISAKGIKRLAEASKKTCSVGFPF